LPFFGLDNGVHLTPNVVPAKLPLIHRSNVYGVFPQHVQQLLQLNVVGVEIDASSLFIELRMEGGGRFHSL